VPSRGTVVLRLMVPGRVLPQGLARDSTREGVECSTEAPRRQYCRVTPWFTDPHALSQEDRWTGPEELGELGYYFGIFDGHGGIFTPEYLARHMHKSLITRYASIDPMQRGVHTNTHAGTRTLAHMHKRTDVHTR
jgi:hypothetical protein